jgi:uncharacterized protein (DUF488 family)
MAQVQSVSDHVLFTIGHGTLSADGFIAHLKENAVASLVDVRAFPRSRHNPQFDQAALKDSLADAGIEYRWAERLGGRRRSTSGSANMSLRNAAFRAYADYMGSEAFWDALGDALRHEEDKPIVVMCSESVWWRCHRRLIADAVMLVMERPVEHIMPTGKRTRHIPTAGVRVLDRRLIYDR